MGWKKLNNVVIKQTRNSNKVIDYNLYFFVSPVLIFCFHFVFSFLKLVVHALWWFFLYALLSIFSLNFIPFCSLFFCNPYRLTFPSSSVRHIQNLIFVPFLTLPSSLLCDRDWRGSCLACFRSTSFPNVRALTIFNVPLWNTVDV